ncbi:hypothetical protein LP416_27910 [Polaromonas sp. P2-4]|nr:hypothetical protein LP416_27910 [Polaromonas sp. P2-4]
MTTAWKTGKREEHADALILLQDHQLLKYAGLWRTSMLTRVSSYPIDSGWRELWECVTLDYKLLADMADETENRALSNSAAGGDAADLPRWNANCHGHQGRDQIHG